MSGRNSATNKSAQQLNRRAMEEFINSNSLFREVKQTVSCEAERKKSIKIRWSNRQSQASSKVTSRVQSAVGSIEPSPQNRGRASKGGFDLKDL